MGEGPSEKDKTIFILSNMKKMCKNAGAIFEYDDILTKLKDDRKTHEEELKNKINPKYDDFIFVKH